MTTSTTDCSQELENQMENMSLFLDHLMQSDEGEDLDNRHYINNAQEFTGIPYLNNQAHQAHAPCSTPARLISDIQPTTSLNYGLVGASQQYPKHMVTSVLANASNLKSSTDKYVSNFYPRMRRRINYKQAEYDPDTSSIDIDATMKELGLTPESLTPNRVHKLFSLFSDLEFSIHAEFITTSVYDLKTIPNTMSVSAQTKSAVRSSQKLLCSLLEVLNRPMPAEYKSAYNKCEEALGELKKAIGSLERFKYCTLEHRKGDFIGQDAEEYLEPLMATLNHLTECIGKSRMFFQVYERALNAPERYKAALVASREEDHRQRQPEETYTAAPSCSSRPHLARRYIG